MASGPVLGSGLVGLYLQALSSTSFPVEVAINAPDGAEGPVSSHPTGQGEGRRITH